MNIKTINISWQEIECVCNNFCTYNNTKFDYIISITRGGWVPSVIISHVLNIRNVLPFQIYETESDNINSNKNKPIIGSNINFNCLKDKTVLIIDDIFGSGATLDSVVKYLKDFAKNIISFVCIINDDNYKGEYDLPNYIGKHINGWAIFPWEVNDERKIN